LQSKILHTGGTTVPAPDTAVFVYFC